MAYQGLANCMDVPVCPEQSAGWSVPYVYHGQNISWTVACRKGSLVLRIEKLSPDQVREFNADKWAKVIR